MVMRGQSSTRSFIPEISSPQNDKELYAFKQGNVFLLGNSNIQYALSLNETTGKLSVLHWGPVLSTISPLLLPHDEDVSGGDEHSSIYTDFPIYGDGDDREPALKVSRRGTGIRSFDFRYRGYTVQQSGKMGELSSSSSLLPCTYTEHENESKTLIVELYDEQSSIEIKLFYTIFRDFHAIARHVEIINHGQYPQDTISIERLASWSIDLPPSPHEEGYSFLQLQGAWAREA